MTYYATYTPQQAHDDITALFDAYYDAKKADVHAVSIPPNKRIESADAIVEHYVEVNGERPPSSVLSRLATYLLLDNLTDDFPDKVSRDDYPILSYTQIGRRRREIPSENVYFDKSDFGGMRTVYEKDDNNDTGDAKYYPVYSPIVDEVDVRIEASMEVKSILNKANLTYRQRQAIDLIYFRDLTQEQAAKVMGVRKHTTNEHLALGLRNLREKAELLGD